MSLEDKAIDVPTFLANIKEIYTSDFRWKSSEKYVKLSDAEKEIQTLVKLLERVISYDNDMINLADPYYRMDDEFRKEITQILKKYDHRG